MGAIKVIEPVESLEVFDESVQHTTRKIIACLRLFWQGNSKLFVVRDNPNIPEGSCLIDGGGFTCAVAPNGKLFIVDPGKQEFIQFEHSEFKQMFEMLSWRKKAVFFDTAFEGLRFAISANLKYTIIEKDNLLQKSAVFLLEFGFPGKEINPCNEGNEEEILRLTERFIEGDISEKELISLYREKYCPAELVNTLNWLTGN